MGRGLWKRHVGSGLSMKMGRGCFQGDLSREERRVFGMKLTKEHIFIVVENMWVL